MNRWQFSFLRIVISIGIVSQGIGAALPMWEVDRWNSAAHMTLSLYAIILILRGNADQRPQADESSRKKRRR